ncbi:TetR/AcrR family transcriptional regulator [Janthinobacterium agaricidamnosum]|uniref:Bacterial regulatory s, tetR family protein n=1 Tax=Janthinobacterium agaricidamnosum NBRC 102515 = DSM 9628 TaxID=1349767 RepID=W0V7Y5_9BURK|nr:TetR/AcrR family transcriptional regulator [Janthinobacterium agaricidamnosum]CDG83392.1 bacterial regulatory s, tetR family protein [Janthinobacterium agaricidamnosum NBRC 102515 = DSM 9628]
MNTTVPARRRNAAATRAAILASARWAFAQSGYDGAGVRDIAAGAGVTAMLVNRYFGSKEQLFAEAVAETMKNPTILVPDILGSPTPGEAVARALVNITRLKDAPLDGFLILLQSASSPRAAEIGRGQVENGHQKLMSSALSGDDASLRAAVLLSMVAGFQFMRQMIGLSALTEADPEALVKILAPLFQQIFDARHPAAASP